MPPRTAALDCGPHADQTLAGSGRIGPDKDGLADVRIDLTLVAGRRPDLLAATLASFDRHLFARFEIGAVFANIDPFCGTGAEGDACEGLLRARFPQARIRRPALPSFGAAVRHLWAQPQAEVFLHLEDDWTMTEDLGPDRIGPEFHSNVVQVQMTPLARWKSPHSYSYATRWRSLLGLKLGKVYDLSRPLFTTSPSFLRRDFAAGCAALMDPGLDPEKQLYSGTTPLADFTRAYRCRILSARTGGPLVVDLGRDWLRARGVEKEIVGGVSRWRPTAAPR